MLPHGVAKRLHALQSLSGVEAATNILDQKDSGRGIVALDFDRHHRHSRYFPSHFRISLREWKWIFLTS